MGRYFSNRDEAGHCKEISIIACLVNDADDQVDTRKILAYIA